MESYPVLFQASSEECMGIFAGGIVGLDLPEPVTFTEPFDDLGAVQEEQPGKRPDQQSVGFHAGLG
jgi:hypothetical protein